MRHESINKLIEIFNIFLCINFPTKFVRLSIRFRFPSLLRFNWSLMLYEIYIFFGRTSMSVSKFFCNIFYARVIKQFFVSTIMIDIFTYKKQQSTNRVNAIYGITTGSAFLSVVRSSK